VSLIGALLLRDGSTCAYCLDRVHGLDFEVDHVRRDIPANEVDRPGNLVISCPDCNRARSNKPVPRAARAEVNARLRRPIDLVAGRFIGDSLYPWENQRRANRNSANRRRRATQRYGVGGPTFDVYEF